MVSFVHCWEDGEKSTIQPSHIELTLASNGSLSMEGSVQRSVGLAREPRVDLAKLYPFESSARRG